MGVDRWRKAWRAGRPAFHRDAVHADLVAYHDEILGGADRVLVPLSGRSLDLAWLAERGHEVVGVEIVEEVVAAYFADRGLEVAPAPAGPFRAYRSGSLTVLAGDMLAATPEHLGTFDGAWDRAALVALPTAERPAYAPPDASRRPDAPADLRPGPAARRGPPVPGARGGGRAPLPGGPAAGDRPAGVEPGGMGRGHLPARHAVSYGF